MVAAVLVETLVVSLILLSFLCSSFPCHFVQSKPHTVLIRTLTTVSYIHMLVKHFTCTTHYNIDLHATATCKSSTCISKSLIYHIVCKKTNLH